MKCLPQKYKNKAWILKNVSFLQTEWCNLDIVHNNPQYVCFKKRPVSNTSSMYKVYQPNVVAQ